MWDFVSTFWVYLLIAAFFLGHYYQPAWRRVEELDALHQRRLSAARAPAVEFSSTNLLGQYEALNELRVKALIDRGLARFVDGQCNTFRYTFKGALLNATAGYLKGMKRAQAQKERVKIRRPGA